MTTIAEVAVRFKGDAGSLIRDAQQQGSQAGDAAGQSFASKFGPAIASKVAWGALAAGAAVAVKGLVDLDSATQRYRATTGATQADVDNMQRTTLDLYRHNLDSIDQITDVLATLRTDMGLTQDEADAAAQSFLNYAKVTGQDDVGAVKSFDDILDAWGLTAGDAQGIMDKLVVSHQKYGGSITENQAALAHLAPQLKALNVDTDGAIGLLNLFASSGLDASKATAALNTAVAKLKPGQSLDDLIKQIAAIEDPTKRAQAAMDVFGAKGGTALANALKPGVTGLKDFEVSTQAAAGATTKASDEINDSLENKVKLAIKDIGGAFLQVASQGGPMLQFASVGMPVVLRAVHELDALLTATAATSGIRWAAILGPLGIAGLGLLGLAALKDQVDKINQAQRDAAASAGDQTKVQADLNATVKQSADDWTQYDIAMDKSITTQELQARMAGETAAAVAAMGAASHDAGFEVDNLAGKATGFGAAADEMANRWQGGTGKVIQSGTDMDDALLGQFKGVQEQARFAGEHIPSNLAEGITTTREEPLDAFNKLLDMLKHPMTETAETARLIGELMGKKLAQGLTSADPDIRKQARETKQAILDRLDELGPAAGTVSKKAMDQLVAGMKSKDPEIRGEAIAIYQTIQSQLALKDAKLWAQHAADAYAEGFASRQDYLAEKTRIFLAGASRQMIAASPPKEGPLKDIQKWANSTGIAWVDGFVAALEQSIPKTELTLKRIQAEFVKAINDYAGVGGQMPAASPEEQRKVLQGYINDLTAQLGKTTDPAERNRIEAQIADYTNRLADLTGKVGTADEKAIDALRGYIAHLDKALLTESDPAKRKQILDEITAYRIRVDALTDKMNAPTPDKVDAPDPLDVQQNALELQKLDLDHQRALLAATPELEKQNDAQIKILDAQLDEIQGQLDGIAYQKQRNALLLEQVNLQRAAAGLAALDALPAGAGGSGGAANAGPATLTDATNPFGLPTEYFGGDTTGASGYAVTNADLTRDLYLPGGVVYHTYGGSGVQQPSGPTINVDVYNPAPEPASTSTTEQLQILAATGVLG